MGGQDEKCDQPHRLACRNLLVPGLPLGPLRQPSEPTTYRFMSNQASPRIVAYILSEQLAKVCPLPQKRLRDVLESKKETDIISFTLK